MIDLTLGFSASLNDGAIAIISQGNVIQSETIGVRGSHNKIILSKTIELLKSNGFSIKDVHLLAVDIGPGSFTGIRLALSVVRSLSWISKKPVIQVCSLDVLAYGASDVVDKLSDEFVITLDARRGSLYAAKYKNELGFPCISQPRLVKAEELTVGLHEGTQIFGIAPKLYNINWAEDCIFPQDIRYSPSAFANLIVSKAAQNDFSPWHSVTPLYLRRPEAEEVWEKRQKKLESQLHGNQENQSNNVR